MKKTLIALAAVAVTSAAFAQNVTISGRVDLGTVSSKTTGSQNSTTAKNSTLAGAQGTKTGSRITFAGTEDLGGGLTAFFNVESSLNNSVIGNRNLFVGARGSFGSVQIGRYLNTHSAIRDAHYSIAGGAGGAFLNQHLAFTSSAGDTLTNYGQTALATVSATSTAGTGGGQATNFFVRSGNGAATNPWVQLYATTSANVLFSTVNGVAATPTSLVTIDTEANINAAVRAANAANAAALNGLMTAYSNRSNNAIAYTAPKFGDFTLTVGLVDDKVVANDPRTDRAGENQAKVSSQSYSLAYAKGPLAARVTIGNGKITNETQGSPASGTAGAVTAVGASSAKANDTALMVSYDFGVAQAYVMHNETEAKLSMYRGAAANAKRETKATEIGVKMPMGAVEPFVTIGRGEVQTSNNGVSNTATNVKTSAYQLGLNYTLSKRTHVYASTGQFKAKTTANTDKTTGYSIGLVHNF